MNEYPYIVSATVRAYSSDIMWESYRRERIVMAKNGSEAKNKFIKHFENHYKVYKVKCVNMEIEEPII